VKPRVQVLGTARLEGARTVRLLYAGAYDLVLKDVRWHFSLVVMAVQLSASNSGRSLEPTCGTVWPWLRARHDRCGCSILPVSAGTSVLHIRAPQGGHNSAAVGAAAGARSDLLPQGVRVAGLSVGDGGDVRYALSGSTLGDPETARQAREKIKADRPLRRCSSDL
jgi:hypothetical protein